jgi:hypothetical protein
MCAELVEEALKLPRYRQQIEEADVQIPVRDDPRTFIPQTGVSPKVARAETISSRPQGEEGVDYILTKNQRERPSMKEMISKEDDLQQTIKEQDDRLKKMEEMMAQMAAMMSVRQ